MAYYKPRVKRIAKAVDLVHEMLADGKSGRRVLEHLMASEDLDFFEANQALNQARRELEA